MLYSPASNKINKIFSGLTSSKYSGDLTAHHFAVVIRNGKVVSPVLCNYSRSFVFGKKRGTMHAEMNSLNYILNIDNCHINHRIKNHKDVHQPKGTRQSKGDVPPQRDTSIQRDVPPQRDTSIQRDVPPQRDVPTQRDVLTQKREQKFKESYQELIF